MMSLILLLCSVSMQGQEVGADYVADSIVTPNFFIAVIAGVLLAMGFQFILTALSVAAGITALGDLREKYIHYKYGLNKEHFDDDEDDKDDKDDSMSTGTMVTTGFGIWSVITVSLSLFGATALAINLSLIANSVISITLGLVIWATFFILMFYLESKVVNSLVGGLINTATAGLRASGDAVKGMFTTSKEQQMKNVAEDTVNKIRKDFSASFDPHAIHDTIDEFFKRLDKTLPDYEQVKKDVQKIIEESNEQKAQNEERIQEKASKSQGGGSSATKWMTINSVLTHAISESSRGGNGDQDQSKTEQLKRLQKDLKQAYGEGGTNEEKLEKVISRMTPMEEEQVHSYIEKIKEVLSKATPNDMDQNQLHDKMMQVVKNPTVEGPKLASKLKEVDRQTIVDVLSKNTSLERNQVERYADKVEQLLHKVSGSMSGSGDGDSSAFADLKRKLESEISKFTNGPGGSGVNFSSLTSLFQSKMDNQNESLQSVKYKLKNMDRDQLAAIVTSNTSLKQEHIDKVVTSIEDARNNVLDRVNKIEDTATRKLKNLQRKAVIEAENTRKNAAAAAWWVVVSAVISAGAAIGGSLIALG